jgi:hypothetical protein
MNEEEKFEDIEGVIRIRNQNPLIEQEQTTQWSKDNKGVIRIR